MEDKIGLRSQRIKDFSLDKERISEVLLKFNSIIGFRKRPDQYVVESLYEFMVTKLSYFTIEELLKAAMDYSNDEYEEVKISTEVLTASIMGKITKAYLKRNPRKQVNNHVYQEKVFDAFKEGKKQILIYYHEFKEKNELTIPEFSINYYANFMEKNGMLKLSEQDLIEIKEQALQRVAQLNNMPGIKITEKSMKDLINEESPDIIRQINRRKILVTFKNKLNNENKQI